MPLQSISWGFLLLKSLICPVAHLPLHSATGWHLQKPPICCYLTHRDGKAIFCSAGGLRLILSQMTASIFFFFVFFPFSICGCVLKSLSVRRCSTSSTFSLFFFLHTNFTRLKGFWSQYEMTLKAAAAAAAAAHIDQFSFNFTFNPGDRQRTKMLWHSPGRVSIDGITVTSVVCFSRLIRHSENRFIKPSCRRN